MKKHVIFGIHITDRIHHAGDVQKLFTAYGCNIKTRIGLHEVSENVCSPNGLIILEMFGDEAKCDELAQKLQTVHNVDVQRMVFEHP